MTYTKTYTYTVPANTKNSTTIIDTGVYLPSNEKLNSITINSGNITISNITSSAIAYPRFAIVFFVENGASYSNIHNGYYYAPTDNNIITLPANGTTTVSISEETKTVYVNSDERIYIMVSAQKGSSPSYLTENSISIINSTITFTFNVTVTVTSYVLNVTNGTGSGDYEEGKEVAIIADSPASGKVFDKWTVPSGLEFVYGGEYTPYATFRMPAEAVSVTATYTDKSSAISTAGRYSGSAYQAVTPLRYDGTNWIECEVKRYDGTNWITIDPT